ncbi:hypothetical protein A2159_03135 [Candidatus Woesebacteria bacterium RBG_13_34_9]|uniref:Peptidase C39-like domain-containing protein n=1 Tax=Candidatus Woesebacteria bacterium RBG_13_34_9 TaxID=1802477 RepID=A0A1F7X0Q0_9BACT|nr:MAG: hypothetical protein A2159_03135 [Candidatus Woesebacteria bacterium RBG_13_34_9]
MIEIAKVNSLFIQNCGSCVLSSYAIVSNYFTNLPIEQFFEDYCRHFGLSFNTWQEAELAYAQHFDQEWRRRACRGYEVILDLHQNSTQHVFEQSRKIFLGHFYLDSTVVVSELENQLRNEESFLNITYEPGVNYHSITIFYDGINFRYRDTNNRSIGTIGLLTQIGRLRDSILYASKR